MILKRDTFQISRFRAVDPAPLELFLRVPYSLGGRSNDGWIELDGRRHEVRTEPFRFWLMPGDDDAGEALAFAEGNGTLWRLQIQGREHRLRPRIFGKSESTLSRDGREIGTIAARRFGTEIRVDTSHSFTPLEQAFLAVLAVYGWREVRGALSTGGGGGG